MIHLEGGGTISVHVDMRTHDAARHMQEYLTERLNFRLGILSEISPVTRLHVLCSGWRLLLHTCPPGVSFTVQKPQQSTAIHRFSVKTEQRLYTHARTQRGLPVVIPPAT
jgi:hypothetical protein